MDIKRYASDLKSEEQGVWVDVDETAKILVARTGNKAFQKFLRTAMRPHRQAVRLGALSEAVAEKIMNEAIANTILLGWSGLTENGEELVYSREAALKLLSAPHLKDFRTLVIECSENQELFRVQEIEADSEAVKK